MTTAPEYIDELIASYLAGEATPEQIALVEEWRNVSAENKRYFDQMRLIFDQAASLRDSVEFDTDEAWRKIREKLPSKQRSFYSDYGWLKMAAGIIIFIAAGIFAYRSTSNQTKPEVIAAGEVTLADTLPDGSQVFLNRRTSLEYAFDKKSEVHTARLSGEAYFRMHHEEDKTFIVEAAETFIRDIGTSFNVTAYPGDSTVMVFVEEGEVHFYTKNDPGISLRASERGIYNRSSGTFTRAQPEVNITAYKTKSFDFVNHSLSRVIRDLNKVYDTEVRIDERLKNCRITVSFHEESLDEIVDVISETLGLKVSKEGSVVWLRGDGCGEAPRK